MLPDANKQYTRVDASLLQGSIRMQWVLQYQFHGRYGWSWLTTCFLGSQASCVRELARLDPGDGVIIYKFSPDIEWRLNLAGLQLFPTPLQKYIIFSILKLVFRLILGKLGRWNIAYYLLSDFPMGLYMHSLWGLVDSSLAGTPYASDSTRLRSIENIQVSRARQYMGRYLGQSAKS